jgi:rfaE bifunctional protein kinase chain/domain
MDLAEVIRTGFSGKRVAVVGDLVADQFLNGTITRVSREAPVFILRHEDTETLPGAAANAAANVASLGGDAVLIGVAGRDDNGERLLTSLGSRGVDIEGVVVDPAFSTTTKQRILAGHQYGTHQQVLRVDYENSGPLPVGIKTRILSALSSAVESVDAVVISDYGCGGVFPDLFFAARQACQRRGIPLLVDSRRRLSEFEGGAAATPNREEVEEILGAKFTDDDCENLRQRLGYAALLVTNGNRGVYGRRSGAYAGGRVARTGRCHRCRRYRDRSLCAWSRERAEL